MKPEKSEKEVENTVQNSGTSDTQNHTSSENFSGIKESRFIKIKKVEKRYDVFNHKKEYLGEIGYYQKWKCWIWIQDKDAIMTSECLETILENLKRLDECLKK